MHTCARGWRTHAHKAGTHGASSTREGKARGALRARKRGGGAARCQGARLFPARSPPGKVQAPAVKANVLLQPAQPVLERRPQVGVEVVQVGSRAVVVACPYTPTHTCALARLPLCCERSDRPAGLRPRRGVQTAAKFNTLPPTSTRRRRLPCEPGTCAASRTAASAPPSPVSGLPVPWKVGSLLVMAHLPLQGGAARAQEPRRRTCARQGVRRQARPSERRCPGAAAGASPVNLAPVVRDVVAVLVPHAVNLLVGAPARRTCGVAERRGAV